ncbi:MAG: SPOR domain-containing protein [Flavobacteriales bacterium]|nr:SPOR domain-containing protein [Flavobacteriales bacterium]
MKIFLGIIFSFSSFLIAKAQDTAVPDSTKSHRVDIIKDSRIDKLNETYSSGFKLEGYRIQIYSGNKRQPAKDARLAFSRIYRKTEAYEVYEQPYYKVRVGDFKTKIEALKFKNDLTKHFPNCFIVRDEIEYGAN